LNTKNLSIPEDTIINMLKRLPKDVLVDIFWKTLVESDTTPLTFEEKEDIEKGIKEFQNRNTIKWKDIT
jgi:hypothetical protein